jgi:hypothetical protein
MTIFALKIYDVRTEWINVQNGERRNLYPSRNIAMKEASDVVGMVTGIILKWNIRTRSWWRGLRSVTSDILSWRAFDFPQRRNAEQLSVFYRRACFMQLANFSLKWVVSQRPPLCLIAAVRDTGSCVVCSQTNRRQVGPVAFQTLSLFTRS